VAVVREAVEQCGGHLGVAEDAAYASGQPILNRMNGL
jgi:hypothetical protein